jgi:LmbE family N-acetylglucosaminyl deacetylase
MFTKEFLAKQRMLVVAPHADDETAGAGGLMARVKQAGGEVYVMVASVGDLDHFVEPGKGKAGGVLPVKGATRRKELEAAMKTLGVDDFEILLEDMELHLRLDTIPRRDLVDLIERKGRLCTERVKPTMMVLPAPSFNQDHEALFKAGITACRPHLATMKSFQSVVLVADAPQLAWGTQPGSFKPNFYVDISDLLELKLKAFSCHKSQIRPSPHQGGLDALKLLAEWRGREISVQAAEAFECHRFVM